MKMAPKTKLDTTEGEKQAGLRISARVDGFRRCGRAWPASGVTVDASEFTEEQIATLKAEPNLVVTEVAE
jgi:hypothetical protein